MKQAIIQYLLRQLNAPLAALPDPAERAAMTGAQLRLELAKFAGLVDQMVEQLNKLDDTFWQEPHEEARHKLITEFAQYRPDRGGRTKPPAGRDE